MRLIGLTGRSGSGKSTVGKTARELGIPVFDCDRIYRELTSSPTEFLHAIQSVFGEETVRDGALYRPVLREKVFTDHTELDKLNALTAEYMTREVNRRLLGLSSPTVLLDAPTLFESGMDRMCDLRIGVIASDENCLQRIMRRDGIDRQAAELRLANQHSADFFRTHCDIVLQNDGTAEEFRAEVRRVLQCLQKEEN